MIVLDNGRRTTIEEGRLARLVRWLLRHRGKYEHQDKVQLVFDLAGAKGAVTVRERLNLDSRG